MLSKGLCHLYLSIACSIFEAWSRALLFLAPLAYSVSSSVPGCFLLSSSCREMRLSIAPAH